MTKKTNVQFEKMKWIIIAMIALLVIVTFMVMWGDLMKGGGTNAVESILNFLSTPQG